MKVPIGWLKELVKTKATPAQLVKLLNMGGLETSIEGNVLEVDILPNRADCWSILGIAREVAALSKSKLQTSNIKTKETTKPIFKAVKVKVRESKKCPRYMARVIEGVTVGESPEWLKKKLESVGARPINNVVDVTNLLMLELGQPMHAFDAELVKDRTIIVRRALPGEKVKTLDGKVHDLKTDMLVIADPEKAIAVAGVMGAGNTEIRPITQTVILESAYFDRLSVHRTSSDLKLRSDSSIRFGHGVDWEMVEQALDRGAALIAKLGKGQVLKGKIDIKAGPRKLKKTILRPERANKILGTDISAVEMKAILKRLGFRGIGKSYIVPSWRVNDVEREADLIEEIARVYGYGEIKASLPCREYQNTRSSDDQRIHAMVREVMVGCGLTEVQTFTLVGPSNDEAVAVANPMTIEEGFLRTKMIPSLLKVLQHNLNRQQENVYIFEIGKTFIPGQKKLPQEKWILCAAATGSPFVAALDKGKADYFYLKAILDNLFNALGAQGIRYIEADDSQKLLQPGRGAFVPGIGMIGELHPDQVSHYGFAQPVAFFEIDLDALSSRLKTERRYKPLPKFPSVSRDIAMIIPRNVEHNAVVQMVKQIGGEVVEDVFIFDKFKDSQAYRLIYRRAQRTLTDEEVNSIHHEIIRNLETKLGVRVR